jgi:hypothetical protein
MLVDVMKLANWTFQSCRHVQPGTSVLLNILQTCLKMAEEDGNLVADSPECQLNSIPAYVFKDIQVAPDRQQVRNIVDLNEMKQQLLFLVYMGTQELIRLVSSGSTKAVRSLGYALHNIPDLIVGGEQFDPQLFEFSFRVAAGSWSEYSREMQASLCRTAKLDMQDVEARIEQDGYAIEF